MPVSPDYMAYGNEIDFDAQVAEWIKEERANMFARLAEVEAENDRLRRALEPFAAIKMPGLRKTLIDYDRNGLRRCISPMEIACRDASLALSHYRSGGDK